VARPRHSAKDAPLPPPLPPETRTIGQLVAETLRLYGANVALALAIGVPPALVDVLATDLSRTEILAIVPFAGLVLTPSYILAAHVVTRAPLGGRALLTAYVAGVLVFAPFPFLATFFILPGLAWFALLGLAVPAALVERLDLPASLRRAAQLGRADFVHALGGLATLTIVVFLTRSVAYVLLQNLADNTARVAAVLADVVISPVLFLGAALLYVDQAARVGSRSRRRRNQDAAVPDADDVDREGRADPELESSAPP
jgi:hypothetical protein